MILLFTVLLSQGCGTLLGGERWGRNATLNPKIVPWKRATVRAFADPWTWVPLGLAGVLLIDDWDEEVSEWAMDETPIFGSRSNANDVTGDLRDALSIGSIISTVATPSGPEAKSWAWSKTKGLGLRMLAREAARGATDGLKDLIDRERPNELDSLSMPSGHTSSAFAHATWTRLNVDYISMPDELRLATKVTALGMATATGWGRVEAGKHFPTDVLSGAALGNATSRFVYEAFLGLPEPGSSMPRITISIMPGESLAIGLGWSF